MFDPRFERRKTWARSRTLDLRWGFCSISRSCSSSSSVNSMRRDGGILQLYL